MIIIILWGYNGTIIYHSSKMYKNKSNHIDYQTFIKEKDLYHKLDIIFDTINKTKMNNNNLIELFINLIKNLIKVDILKENDLNVIKFFLDDLSNIGYIYSRNFSKEINYNYKSFLKIYSEFSLYLPSNNKYFILNNNKDTCNITKIINHYFYNNKFINILLIINYNNKGLDILNDYMLKLYKNYFDNIVFITPDKVNKPNTISCKETYRGYYSYIYMKKIYNKYPLFKGYLFINDDDFIKIWELDNLDYNIPWLYTFQSINIGWSNYKYCRSIYNIINNNIIWKENLIKFIGHFNIPVGISDFYYLPNSVILSYLEILEKMYNSRIFLECAVPTSMGIMFLQKYQIVYFKGLWGKNRKNPIDYLKKEFKKITIHPIKFSNFIYKIKVNLYIYFINAVEY